jgi:hypothetical protein
MLREEEGPGPWGPTHRISGEKEGKEGLASKRYVIQGQGERDRAPEVEATPA